MDEEQYETQIDETTIAIQMVISEECLKIMVNGLNQLTHIR